MYVDNDEDEDQDFTAIEEPDQKKSMFLLMKSMIQRMIYLISIDIYELDHEVSDQSTIQSKVFYNLNITCQIINQMEQSLLLQITCLDKKKYREWKKYIANSESTKNTLPAHSNRSRVEVQVEAMALHMIMEELMTGEAYVVYSNDCSAQNGVGSCSVFKKMLKEICLLLEYSQKKETPFLT